MMCPIPLRFQSHKKQILTKYKYIIIYILLFIYIYVCVCVYIFTPPPSPKTKSNLKNLVFLYPLPQVSRIGGFGSFTISIPSINRTRWAVNHPNLTQTSHWMLVSNELHGPISHQHSPHLGPPGRCLSYHPKVAPLSWPLQNKPCFGCFFNNFAAGTN